MRQNPSTVIIWGMDMDLDIIGKHGLPWQQLDQLDVINKLLGVFDLVRRLAHQGSDDVNKLLGHPMGDHFPPGYNGPNRSAYFKDFGESIKLGGTALVG